MDSSTVTMPRRQTDFQVARGRSTCAHSGWSKRSLAPAAPIRHAWMRLDYSSSRCSATPTTSGSTPNRLAPAARLLGTFRRLSRTWPSSAPPSTLTEHSDRGEREKRAWRSRAGRRTRPRGHRGPPGQPGGGHRDGIGHGNGTAPAGADEAEVARRAGAEGEGAGDEVLRGGGVGP